MTYANFNTHANYRAFTASAFTSIPTFRCHTCGIHKEINGRKGVSTPGRIQKYQCRACVALVKINWEVA